MISTLTSVCAAGLFLASGCVEPAQVSVQQVTAAELQQAPLMQLASGSSNSASKKPVLGKCGAADLEYLIGKSEKALEKAELPKKHRIIKFGKAYTQDINFRRLSITVNRKGIISALNCR